MYNCFFCKKVSFFVISDAQKQFVLNVKHEIITALTINSYDLLDINNL